MTPKLVLEKVPGGGWDYLWELAGRTICSGWSAGTKAEARAEAKAHLREIQAPLRPLPISCTRCGQCCRDLGLLNLPDDWYDNTPDRGPQ